MMAESPPDLEHETDSEQCWCSPDILQPCPNCVEWCTVSPNRMTLTLRRDEDCNVCGGIGLVKAYTEGETKVIAHR